MNDMHVVESLLQNYQPSPETIDIVRTTPIVLLVGISGAGKGTIRKKLFESGDYINFISHTTRSPRENNGVMEQNGVEYYFISIETAIDMLQRGDFIEAKSYSGNVYGTTTTELQKAKASGKIALNDVEIQGVAEYLKIAPSVKVIFIVPPSHEAWLARLVARYEGEINHDDLNRRLETAKQELQVALADTRFSFIINDDLEQAVQDVENIVKHGSHDDSKARAVATQILAYLSSENRADITNEIIASLTR
jgi:guanylate kinase